jgi:hypothetical protein
MEVTRWLVEWDEEEQRWKVFLYRIPSSKR